MKKIQENILIPNTFGLQAHARSYAEFGSVAELKEILAAYRESNKNSASSNPENNLPVLVVGSGSNLLLQNDYEGLVLRSAMNRVLHLTEDDDAVYIDCGAGIVLDELIEQVTDMGLHGMENLSYIPGTVGASAVQNVGAYRTEAKDVITEVHAVEIATGEERVFSNAECRFGYRDSIFKNELAGKFVITSVTYKLLKQGETSPRAKRAEIIETRQAKLPEVAEFGSAGSFFKNPIVTESQLADLLNRCPDMPHYDTKLVAAWLIDQSGMKGRSVGGAKVWEKQPLVIVNTGSATAEEIAALAEEVREAVKAKFGVELTPEVNYIG